jgi:hypothetical protein
MSYAQTLFNRLAGDAPLLAVLTGGVHFHEALSHEGAARLPSSAYDPVTRVLRPLAVVRGRALVNTFQLQQRSRQFAPVRQAIEVWLYDDRDAPAASLKTARGLVYALMHERPPIGAFECTCTAVYEDLRAPEYGDARMERLDFDVLGRLKVGT